MNDILRSFVEVIDFLAKAVAHEYDVEPFRHTQELPGYKKAELEKRNPRYTLEIKLGPQRPAGALYAVLFRGKWFWVPTEAKDAERAGHAGWNVEAFMKLYHLYQASGIDTSKLLAPPVITLPR